MPLTTSPTYDPQADMFALDPNDPLLTRSRVRVRIRVRVRPADQV